MVAARHPPQNLLSLKALAAIICYRGAFDEV
jgi:hypothetical protein